MRKIFKHNCKNCHKERVDMNLIKAKEGEEYIIKEILTDDEELDVYKRQLCGFTAL